MTTPTFRFEQLPSDLFTQLTHFLPGLDLLSLSHVNHALLMELLAPNAIVWTQRVAAADPTSRGSAKQRYATSRSFRFPGSSEGLEARGGAVAVPPEVRSVCGQSSFSMSLWFALDAAAPPLTNSGGILLGAQSIRFSDQWWAHYHQQLIHVDPEGNLYCSVTYTKGIVVRGLEPGRWCHLVLTYEKVDAEQGVQTVYLDGECIDTSTGGLHHEWSRVSNWQLGSGCISGGSKGEPSQGYCGWYGFCGLLDDFTVWNRVLSPDEIERSSGGDMVAPEAVKWTLKRERNSSWFSGDVTCVRCSRPRERLVGTISAGVPVKTAEPPTTHTGGVFY